jgi:hypothetical protein
MRRLKGKSLLLQQCHPPDGPTYVITPWKSRRYCSRNNRCGRLLQHDEVVAVLVSAALLTMSGGTTMTTMDDSLLLIHENNVIIETW